MKGKFMVIEMNFLNDFAFFFLFYLRFRHHIPFAAFMFNYFLSEFVKVCHFLHVLLPNLYDFVKFFTFLTTAGEQKQTSLTTPLKTRV